MTFVSYTEIVATVLGLDGIDCVPDRGDPFGRDRVSELAFLDQHALQFQVALIL